MTKREKTKFYIFLVFFILATIFVVSGKIRTYKTTGCSGFFQEAQPRFEQMPRGVSFTADEVPYTCSWNKKKIVVLSGVTLIIASSALSKWKKIKTRNSSKIQPTA